MAGTYAFLQERACTRWNTSVLKKSSVICISNMYVTARTCLRLHTHIQTDYRYIGRQKDRDTPRKLEQKKAGEKGTLGG
jgi:hypothetical protein